jgi:enamine deaminase RidA (YjgF/YER057c/UK114 family)
MKPSKLVSPHLRVIPYGNIYESFLGEQGVGIIDPDILNGFSPSSGCRVAQFVFKNDPHNSADTSPKTTTFTRMCLKSCSKSEKHFWCIQTFAIQGTDVHYIEFNQRIVGSYWSDADADYCWLAGIVPNDKEASRIVQTRQVFECMDQVLSQVGMNFHNIVRTWLYLDHLLDWYSDFNTARNSYFQETGVFERRVPASTGIEASNSEGTALIAGGFAIRPKHSGVSIITVDSPLQCTALNYHSSFSRAIEIKYPNRRQLLISGTASIASDGTSIYTDNRVAQIKRTMEVVNEILKSRNMNWDATVRAIAYFKNAEDVLFFEQYCQAEGLINFPVICVVAGICRSDLIFEIELDAIL